MTAPRTDPRDALDHAKNALDDVFAKCGGGWVDSATIKAEMTRCGVSAWHLYLARRLAAIKVMRCGSRSDHRSLWLRPSDAILRKRIPGGTEIVTPIAAGEAGDAHAARHREQVRRAASIEGRLRAASIEERLALIRQVAA